MRAEGSGRRGGDRQEPMGAARSSAPHMDGGDHDPLGMKQINGIAHAGHIRHSVQGAHFMEMHVPCGTAVGLCLCLRDGAVHRSRLSLDLLRKLQ